VIKDRVKEDDKGEVFLLKAIVFEVVIYQESSGVCNFADTVGEIGEDQ